jgi:hypothetical protein
VQNTPDPTPPIFSVLLPTHARADVVGLAVRSVLAQTEADFELLVVGDGAQPGTAPAVLAAGDPRVRWFDLPKAPGFGYVNRNRVLAQARGRYVAHMADDDLILPDHLARLRAMLDSGAVLAATRAVWISSDGIGCPFPNNLALRDENAAFLTRGNSTPSPCFAYRRDALADPEPWPADGAGAGDWHIWKRLLRAHPAASFAVDAAYTVLHFSARRRNSRTSAMPEMVIMLDLADRYDFWPAALRPTIAPGQTEQEIYAAMLDAPGGAETLRQAAARVTDRIAWTFIQDRMPAAARKLEHGPAQRPGTQRVPADFDAATYLRLNPDVAAAGMDPVHHWLRHGQFEGRGYR